MIRVKICGLTNTNDALAAQQAHADFLGFIFSESARQITLDRASSIVQHIPPHCERVGVFVNESKDFISEAIDAAHLTLVQLHGDESPEFCYRLSRPVIKAFRISDEQSIERINEYDIPYILLDTYVRGKIGGTGKVFNWDLAKQAQQRFPTIRFFIAGGLNIDNVADCIDTIQPFCVDTSSGVEKEPGRKNHARLREFIEKVHSYEVS